MAQQTTHSHRRNLAPLLSEPKTSMDPTIKRHPKSNPISSSSTYTTKPHPTPPDPTVTPSTTIHSISQHFAKLYASHKVLASLKDSNSHSHSNPQVDKRLQAKSLSNSSVLDNSCAALTKSNSQHGRKVARDMEKMSTRAKVNKKSLIKRSSHQLLDVEKALAREKFNEVKKSIPKECKEVEFYEVKDVKKASALMSKSLEIDGLKRTNEVSEMTRPSTSLALNGGRRRSFCCSQTELADFFSCSGVKVVAVDMPPFMQIHAVDCARKAYDSLEKFTSKTLALTLKREFDGVYGPAWHCIVGTSFGSFVTHSVGGFMYFSMDQKLYILLFKTTVQRAD